MISKTPVTLAAAIATSVLFSVPVTAQNAVAAPNSFSTETGSAERISAATQLRLLAQMVPAAACQAANGIHPEYANGRLETALGLYDEINVALEQGSETLGFPAPETRRRTLVALEEVRNAWPPLGELAAATIAGTVTDDMLVNAAVTHSDTMYQESISLVVEVSGQYSNPMEMSQAESLLIDVAARQRGLIKTMIKNACLTMFHEPGPEAVQTLADTIEIFGSTMGALENGMPSLGLRKPPTAEIEQALAEMNAHWGVVKPFLEAVVAGEEVSIEAAEHTFKEMDVMLADMHTIVGLYAAAVN